MDEWRGEGTNLATMLQCMLPSQSSRCHFLFVGKLLAKVIEVRAFSEERHEFHHADLEWTCNSEWKCPSEESAEEDDSELMRSTIKIDDGWLSNNHIRDILRGRERTAGQNISQMFCCAHISLGNWAVQIGISQKKPVHVNTVSATTYLKFWTSSF